MRMAGSVCIKNMSFHRLIPHLLSIQSQVGIDFDYVVVDYGSAEEYRKVLRSLVARIGVGLVEVNRNTEPWRHGRAHNIGIRANEHADLIFTTDADLIWPSMGFKAIADAWEGPGSMVVAHRLNVQMAGTIRDVGVEYGALVATDKDWWFAVRGYDEDFSHYGREDGDIADRAKKFGLKMVEIGPHLWHQHHFGTNRTDESATENERIFYERMGMTMRNPDEWGEL